MAAEALAVPAEALATEAGQMELYEQGRSAPRVLPPGRRAKVCAGCRTREARYGFEPEEGTERPHTLCFGCFRMEIDRRHRAAAQLARGWNAEQVDLPLADTLKELDRRRRRAQIAARHAIGA
jgi:hypothetical protein